MECVEKTQSRRKVLTKDKMLILMSRFDVKCVFKIYLNVEVVEWLAINVIRLIFTHMCTERNVGTVCGTDHPGEPYKRIRLQFNIDQYT